MKAFTFVPFVALAAAAPLLQDGLVARKTVNGRDATVSTKDVDNFRFYAQYAAAAYCNGEVATGTVISCSGNDCPDVTADRAVVRATLDGNTASNIEGFVATDPARSLIVVSFRGSKSIRNWITDLLFLMDPCSDLTSGCEAHAGFLSAWADVQSTVMSATRSLVASHPSYRVVVTGHSLGGAVATLAVAYMRQAGIACDLYTFGSPRVGNQAFAAFVTGQPGAEYRLTHTDDPVPVLPPMLLDYRHTSPEFWMFDQDATATVYGPADIRICQGTANVDCSASTTGMDLDAHKYYFEHISGCGSDSLEFKRSEPEDAELLQRISAFAEMDRRLAASLAAANGTSRP